MKCPNEFILSQYADCELSESENRELAAHLEACLVCREQVADLKAENRLLVESVQGIDLCDPHERPSNRSNRSLQAWTAWPLFLSSQRSYCAWASDLFGMWSFLQHCSGCSRGACRGY